MYKWIHVFDKNPVIMDQNLKRVYTPVIIIITVINIIIIITKRTEQLLLLLSLVLQ